MAQRDAAVEWAADGPEVAGPAAEEAGACAAAVQVQRTRVRAYLVVGARIAGVVCACVCAAGHTRPEARRKGPTLPHTAEQAAAQRYLLRVPITCKNLIFSSLNYTHIAATALDYSVETHDHPHGTRQQKLKLHAAIGVAITCYCLHEQHKYHLQAGHALHAVSGAACSLRTLVGARLLTDDDSKAARV